MKKILFVHTRELCYFSGSFFLQQMQKTIRDLGVETEYLPLDTQEDIEDFGKRKGKDYYGVVDMNSKLPYFVLDNDEFLLDTMGLPLYNYIVDHPLYHHPGLVFPLRDYHALGIDKKHCQYMKQYYPHLRQVSFLPLGATKAAEQIPFEKREIPLLFSGTYERETDMQKKFYHLCQKLTGESDGGVLWQLGRDLADLMVAGKNHQELPMEEGLSSLITAENLHSGKYVTTEFPVLMNYLYLVDKYVRNVHRKKILEYVATLQIPMTVIGEGWEQTALAEAPWVRLLGARRIEDSFAFMANSRMILDVNPLFPCGIHDRVTTGMMNGAVVFSDMSPLADERMQQEKHLCYYNNWELSRLGELLQGLSPAEQQEIAARGQTYAAKHYSWRAQGETLLEWMTR